MKYFGELCLVLSFITIVTIISSLVFHEITMAWHYTIVFIIYLTIGLSTIRLKAPRHLQANEGMVVVVIGFLFACLLSSFAIMGKDFTFGDAVFESIACISTTGLSTLPTVEGSSDAFVFQRAWMEWYGSLGFITLCLALLMQSGLSSKVLSGDEYKDNDLAGGAKAHAHQVVKVLCYLSLIGAIGAWILGLSVFDAIVFSLAAVATGGLSPIDSGVGGLSIPLQIWVCIFCILGAIPFTIYYRLRRHTKYLAIDLLQTKTLLIICALVTLGIGTCCYFNSNMSLAYILHNIPLLAIQTQTTAGFTTISCNDLDNGSKIIAIFSMLIGGCVGSTGGGIKILRLLVLFTIIHTMLKKISMSRHAIVQPKLAGIKLENVNILNALLLIVMLLILIAISTFIFIIMGYPPINALFEVVGATTNTGISVGITNAQLPSILKTVLCLDMLIGRLEVVAFLVCLLPGTWIGTRKD